MNFRRRAQSALKPRAKIFVYSQKTGRQIRLKPDPHRPQSYKASLCMDDIIDKKLKKLKEKKAKVPESKEVKNLKRRLKVLKRNTARLEKQHQLNLARDREMMMLA